MRRRCRPRWRAEPGAHLVALIKPQFEVGPENVGKGGIVRDAALHEKTCDGLSRWLENEMNWRVLGVVPSPIEGGDGNREFCWRPVMTAEIEAGIAVLGAQGDGIAETPAGPLFVPYVLPGERVRIRPEGEGRAALVAILEASPDRIEPPCPHFTVCGGCALQHMTPQAYAAWKHAQVEAALRPRGVVANIETLISAMPQSRRRATFAATRSRKTLTLGYHGKASHTIVPVSECPLVVPEIERVLPALAALIGHGLSRSGHASLLVTATASGLDVAVSGGKTLDGPLRAELAKQAAIADLARLTWDGEIVAARRAPLVDLSGLNVAPPPGAFLQPTRDGEKSLVALVQEAVGSAARAADLFA